MAAMNKQELIDKYNAEIAKLRPYCPNRHLISEQLKYGVYKEILSDLKQLDEPQVTAEQAWNKIAEAYPESAQSLRNTLDNAVFGKAGEPQKPVVPKFVAEWFEENKDDLHNNLFGEIGEAWEIVEYPEGKTDFQKWLNATPDCMNIVLSMKNGYEIEKQPLYYIKLPSTYNTFLVESDDGDLIVWQNTDKGTPFTEKRIKEIDENYWPFAVPVEEVAEG